MLFNGAKEVFLLSRKSIYANAIFLHCISPHWEVYLLERLSYFLNGKTWRMRKMIESELDMKEVSKMPAIYRRWVWWHNCASESLFRWFRVRHEHFIWEIVEIPKIHNNLLSTNITCEIQDHKNKLAANISIKRPQAVPKRSQLSATKHFFISADTNIQSQNV